MMARLEARRLKKVIDLQRPESTRDSVGGIATTWETVATVRAEILPISTRERLMAAQARSEITHRVTIRYDSRLSEMDGSWRIRYGSRIFSIDGTPRNIEEANQYFEIVATEGAKDS